MELVEELRQGKKPKVCDLGGWRGECVVGLAFELACG